MNKQEAIERVNELTITVALKGSGTQVLIDQQAVLEVIDQINEPEKPVVPQFVADMIAERKNHKYGIVETIQNLNVFNNPFDYIIENQFKWVIENQEDFIKAWLYGYEIEKEKLYEVIIPHTSNYKNQKQYLVKQGKNWFFCGNDVNRFKYQFTKGQIEAAGFGWVFEKGFAKEVVEGLNDIC